MPYHHFSDMPVWQKAHELVLHVYRLTNAFPKTEVYGLTSQVRRAAVSVSSNIAEGFGRQQPRDKARFYYNARGSLFEVESQLLVAQDLHYIRPDEFSAAQSLIRSTGHDLNKLIKALVR